jgi:ribosomal protein S12 methylthiotransferase
MNFYIINLGCAKNLADSEKIAGLLAEAGYHITDRIEDASFVFINTCGFIKEAKQESIDTILSVLQEKPEDTGLAVYGCLVQRYMSELKELLPEVDLLLPILPHEEVVNEIRELFPLRGHDTTRTQNKILFTPPSYTYIKIADGCMNRCSYCAIPLIRGPLRSFPVENIVRQINNALDNGVYEINLIAQDITLYGNDLYGKPSLPFLLKSILALKRDFLVRLLYLYPIRISYELISTIKSDTRIMHYLDIPVQHVNSRILKLMNRPYTKDVLIEKINMLREKIPDIVLRTSLIVGFPSETEEDFQELADFVRQIQFDHLGVFEYSPEEDTSAFSFRPRVPVRMKRKRRKILMNIQKSIVRAKNMTLTGMIFPCLIELPVDEYGAVWTGRIYSQAPEVDGIVYVTGYNASMGKVANTRIKGFKDYDLLGECE